MKKHKENNFAKKFRLLSSQGSVEEINWSSSDSSELESVISNADNKLNCITNKKSRKRKRRQKVHKNISNLDITFVDSSKDDMKHSIVTESSNLKYVDDLENRTSPILGKSVYFPPYKCQNIPSSPILSSRPLQLKPKEEKTLKSPILLLKSASPKMSPRVRKKLFKYSSNNNEEILHENSKHTNENLGRKKIKKEIEDCLQNFDQTYSLKTVSHLHDNGNVNKYQLLIAKKSPTFTFLKNEELETIIQETPNVETLDDSVVMLKTRSTNLVEKVKTYFDNHFSSDTGSQDTISDIPTPKNNSKTSDDVEITNTITQVSNRNSSDSLKQDVESTEVLSKKDKKFRYKKDGLAYRLNCLLKKQTASISLWQHERFMAANSNFVIPKGEFRAFRICKTHLKYGSYLLEAMDLNDDNFMILIRRNYVSNEIILEGAIFKLYMPYKIKDFSNGFKLIINVCKFEFVSVNS